MQSQRKELKSTTLIYAKLPACGNTAQHLEASVAENEWASKRRTEGVKKKTSPYSEWAEKEGHMEGSPSRQMDPNLEEQMQFM